MCHVPAAGAANFSAVTADTSIFSAKAVDKPTDDTFADPPLTHQQ